MLHCTCCRSQAVLVPLAMRERAAVMGTEPRPLHVVQSNANLICYWSLQSRTCSYMSHILSLRGNLAWDFWGISFWSKVFLEGFVARMRGFDFCPHLIIRSTPSLPTPPPPPTPTPKTPGPTARNSTHLGRQRATSKKSINRSEEN